MMLRTKIWAAAWLLAVLVSAIFILSVIAAVAISALGEVPALLSSINALFLPWGVVAVALMFVLRPITGWSARKDRTAHG
jgi:hypothetical protein